MPGTPRVENQPPTTPCQSATPETATGQTEAGDIDVQVEDPAQVDSLDNIFIDESGPETDTTPATTSPATTPPTETPPVSPPPPPSEPPPTQEQAPEAAVEEAGEMNEPVVEDEMTSEDRAEYLETLIDDFADLSEEEIEEYNEFKELSNKEKVIKILKTGARRAVVYAVVGVGAYALLHAAPIAIVAGAAGGFAGSSLARGVVDAIKWATGAEKKEKEIRGQISEIQSGKLRNLVALAQRVRGLESLPGQQGQNEVGEITTIEQAKADFLNALIDYNNQESESNAELSGLRKKFSKSRMKWGLAKGVAGIVGGVAGGMAGAAEIKAVLADRIAEQGLHMTGGGLGQLDPGIASGHLVHTHGSEVVFDYAGGAGGQELQTIHENIANNPELAQFFQSDLIVQGMHEAGDQMGQQFMDRVAEVASMRTAEYIAGAVGVAEATDAVLRATSRNRAGEWTLGASDELRDDAEKYRGDLQAGLNARQNERFQSMFVDQSGQVPEGVPSIGEEITLAGELSFSVGEASESQDLIISAGEHIRIEGVAQDGSIVATYIEGNLPLVFSLDNFNTNVLQPLLAQRQAETVQPQEEETADDEEEDGEVEEIAEEDNRIEKEREELVGSAQTVKITRVIDSRKFVCDIKDKARRVTLSSESPEPVTQGATVKMVITEVRGDDNEFVRADIERVIAPDDEETETSSKNEKDKEEELRNLVKEALSSGSRWVHREGTSYTRVEPINKTGQSIDLADKVFILDKIEKEERGWFVEIHEVDKTGEDDKLRIDPEKFRQVLIPESVASMPEGEEKERAKGILIEEFKKELNRTPEVEDDSSMNGDRVAVEDTRKSLPPIKQEKSAAERLTEIARERQKAADRASEGYKIVPAEPRVERSPVEKEEAPTAENRLESYTFNYDGEESKEIKPGQNWRLRQHNWDNGMTNVITRIEPNGENALTISFVDGSPRTEGIETWRRMFYHSELISEV